MTRPSEFSFLYCEWTVTVWMTWVGVWAYIATRDGTSPKVGTVKAKNRIEAQTDVIALLA